MCWWLPVRDFVLLSWSMRPTRDGLPFVTVGKTTYLVSREVCLIGYSPRQIQTRGLARPARWQNREEDRLGLAGKRALPTHAPLHPYLGSARIPLQMTVTLGDPSNFHAPPGYQNGHRIRL